LRRRQDPLDVMPVRGPASQDRATWAKAAVRSSFTAIQAEAERRANRGTAER